MGGRGSDPSDCFLPLRAPFPHSQNPPREHSFFRRGGGSVEFRGGWQGWPSGESTCLPPMWPGFDFRTRRHMWVEFVGSLLCYERFSPGYSGFPLSPKTNI